MQTKWHRLKSKFIIAGFIFSVIVIIAGSILVECGKIRNEYAVIPVITGTIFLCVFAYLLAKYDYETGMFICRKCSHSFKPTFKAYFFAAHTVRTRYLKCPQCHRKSWCRKRSIT